MKIIYVEFYIAGDCVLSLLKSDIPDASDVQRNKEIMAKAHGVSVDLVYTLEHEVDVVNMFDTLRGVELLA